MQDSPRSTRARARGTEVRLAVLAVVAGVLAALAGTAACGTEPVGVEACQKIEKVRCESAQACGISLERPVHSGDTPVANVAACVRYYDDQCLHGVVVKREPPPQDVEACVQAIITGDCQVVREPQSHPACAFLVPPTAVAPAADAAADGAADAGADG